MPFVPPLRLIDRVRVTELTDRLMASYAKVGGINHLDGTNLPSKRGIVGITTDLLHLIFPGFFDDKVTHSSEIKMETALLMDSVAGRLEDEILKSIEAESPDDCFSCFTPCSSKTSAILVIFLSTDESSLLLDISFKVS